jgi:hypothetical protein
VYTSAGTSTSVGPILSLPSVSTTIRDNLGGSPDYNGNGIVDAADYTVWRDTLGQEGVGLIADGTRNGVVDQPDYEFWALNFGLVIPPGASSSNLGAQSGFPQELGLGAGTSVPEPATGTLLIGALGILFLRRRFRHLRSVS